MKRYYEDSFIQEFEAFVTQIETNHIYLSHTYFYPESGGQPSDTGFINDQAIEQIMVENDDRIAHIVPKSHHFQVGQSVQCRIDWERRFDHMQQHTGQHLLSGLLVLFFQAVTVSFHIGSELSTIDVHCTDPLNPDEIEDILDRHILKAIPVTSTIYADIDHMPELKLRKVPQTDRNIRIITIGDIDSSPCGGTHVRNTLELQIGKIIGIETYKKGYRIGFVFGRRAINQFNLEHKVIQRLTQIMSSPPFQLIVSVQDLITEKSIQRKEIEEITNQLSGLTGETLYQNASLAGSIRVVSTLIGTNLDTLKRIGQSMKEMPSMVAFLYNLEGSFVMASSAMPSINCRQLLPAQGWKGGGPPNLLQGKFVQPEMARQYSEHILARVNLLANQQNEQRTADYGP